MVAETYREFPQQTNQLELVNTEERIVYLCGEIDEYMARNVVMGLYSLKAKNNSRIRLLISSGGGSLWWGNSITDAIRDIRLNGVQVDAHVFGWSCSAAMFPLLASDRRTASPNAILMVHGMRDVASGDMRNIDTEQALNQRLVAQQAKMLASCSRTEYEEWMHKLRDSLPIYYSAEEAVAEGLIHAVS